MGIGKAKGDEATSRALDNAINSPLLEKVPLDGAKGILIHFTISPEISLFAIEDVMNNINQRVDINAQIIFGTTTDTDFERDEVKITIIATGFEAKNEIKEEQKESDENEIEAIKVEAVESTLDTPPLMRGYTVEYPLH
jgi:cell division protein FtsZ